MKYRVLLIAFLVVLAGTGCAKQENTESSKIEISEVKEEEDSNLQEGTEESTKEETKTPDTGFDFSELENVEFYFGSGVGAWRTVMHVAEDGSFSGEYSDSEMGSIGEGYPNGTYYYCAFEGNFTKPVKVNEYTYSVGIAEINYANEPGTEEIIDEILHVYSMAHGINDANSLLLYLPGAPLEDLPQEYLDWVSMAIMDKDSKELPFYGFYNENNQNGFFSYMIQNPMDALLENAEESAKRIEESLENENLTQAEMNTKSYELYEIWDSVLNQFWTELKNTLPKDEFQTLLNEQRAWITEKEQAVEKAGKEMEGGTAAPLAKNMKAAAMTEERVYELYKMLK